MSGTPDFPKPLSGALFELFRKVGGTPKFMATATTNTFTQTNEFDDATVYDRNNPGRTPSQRSAKKRKGWRLNFSGLLDPKDRPHLQADFDSDDPVPYEIKFDRPLAEGGGAYDGNVFFESLEFGKSDNGLIRFTAQCRGDGEVAWTDAAA